MVLYWHRRDIRLRDNPGALSAAREGGQPVGLFIFDTDLLHRGDYCARRWAFIWRHVLKLKQEYEEAGGVLLIHTGEPVEQLLSAVLETGAKSVCCASDYDTYSKLRDFEASLELRKVGVSLQRTCNNYLVDPDLIQIEREPLTDLRRFSSVWESQVSSLKDDNPCLISSDTPMAKSPPPVWPADYVAKWEMMDSFLGQSRVSVQLECGVVSPRTLFARSDPETHEYLKRRDFNACLLHHHPSVEFGPFRQEYQAMRWRGNPAHLTAWQQGRTGFSLVDAAMRQLAAQGWMPFGVRHYVACFFVKVLLLDYRRGENHFMRHLLDGDIAQNNALWQEAASFSPLSPSQSPSFDPIAEAERLDPGGVYRDEWEPKASPPIVDWERQSELCLEMYEEARSGQAAKRSIQEQIDSEVGQSFWEKSEA